MIYWRTMREVATYFEQTKDSTSRVLPGSFLVNKLSPHCGDN